MSVQDPTGVTRSGGPAATSRSSAPVDAPKLGLALLVIATAQLMLVLDNTAVEVAPPPGRTRAHRGPRQLRRHHRKPRLRTQREPIQPPPARQAGDLASEREDREPPVHMRQ